MATAVPGLNPIVTTVAAIPTRTPEEEGTEVVRQGFHPNGNDDDTLRGCELVVERMVLVKTIGVNK